MLTTDYKIRELGSTKPGRRSILDVSLGELRDWMTSRDQPDYRVMQILEWIIRRRAESFDLMSNVPLTLRRELEAEWLTFGSRVVFHERSPDGTAKLLLECYDRRRVECVLMIEEHRRTVCISTQVGCGMGCIFCASGLKGLEQQPYCRRNDRTSTAAPKSLTAG